MCDERDVITTHKEINTTKQTVVVGIEQMKCNIVGILRWSVLEQTVAFIVIDFCYLCYCYDSMNELNTTFDCVVRGVTSRVCAYTPEQHSASSQPASSTNHRNSTSQLNGDID